MSKRSKTTIANAAFLGVILLTRTTVGESTWPTMVLAYSPLVLCLLPSVALLVICLLRKDRRCTGANLALLGLSTFLLAGFQVGAPKRASGRSFTLLTWNLYYGRAGREVPEMVRRSGADVVLLQETCGWEKEGLNEMMKTPQFAGWHAVSFRTFAIVSRYPLEKAGTIEWSGLVANCKIDGQRIRLINVHPPILYHPRDLLHLGPIPRNIADRARLFRKMEEAIPWDSPVVLAGDFNTPPGTDAYRRMCRQLQNAFERCGTGFGFTFPSPVPVVRIDHIFTGNGCSPVSVRTFGSRRSNHRALAAVLRVAE